MNPLLLLKGESLGQTIYNTLAAIALVGVLVTVGFLSVRGDFWEWRAKRNDARADRNEAVAQTAAANAASANAGAANASQTRAAIDRGVIDIRITTEQAAQRAESHDENPIPDNGAVPGADRLRELSAARARAGAAADRLRREGAR